jgi:hypothetical protein
MDFLQTVKKLGSKIDSLLYSKNSSMRCLSTIGSQQLGNFPEFESPEIIDSLASQIRGIGRQQSPGHTFGDSRFTLYQGGDFIIELNVWQKQTTTIHEHSFSGAFKILDGSALHARYKFASNYKINSDLEQGQLTKVSTDVLMKNDVSNIEIGGEFIHNLVHTSNPTMTLIVRSVGREEKQIYQRDFIGEKFAINGWQYSHASHNAISALKLISNINMREELLHQRIADILEDLNISDTFVALHKSWPLNPYYEMTGLKRALSARHGELLISDVFESLSIHHKRNNEVGGFRDKVQSDRTRSLLAILSVSSNGDEAIRLFNKLFGNSTDRLEMTRELTNGINDELEIFDSEQYEALYAFLPEVVDKENKQQDIEMIRSALNETIFRPLIC